MSQHYNLCVYAHEYATKVEKFSGNVGPDDFENICNKFVRSTMFDEETSVNIKSAKVLPSLLEAFKRHRPQLYSQKRSLLTASYEIEKNKPSILERGNSDEQEVFKTPPENAEIITDLVEENAEVYRALHEDPLQTEGVLDELKARIVNSKWQEFPAEQMMDTSW